MGLGFSFACFSRFRGRVHFYGVGQCVLPPGDVDTSAKAGDTAPVTRLRSMRAGEVAGVWDFVVLPVKNSAQITFVQL